MFSSDIYLHGCFSASFGLMSITGSGGEARFVGRLEAERVQRLLEQSIAPSTRVKYTALWRRWDSYCREVDAEPLPAEPSVFESFLANLAFDGSKTNYAAAAAAVAWRHSIAGFASPAKSPRVVALMAGAKRMLARPTNRKAPLTLDLIHKLIDRVSAPQFIFFDSYSSLRFRFFILASFYAFLRFSDFSVLRLRHFCFFADHMTIIIPQSKCDQYRHGDTVTVAVQSDSPIFCPVVAARRYIDLLRRASATEESFVLQSVTVGRDGALGLGRQASRAVSLAQLRRGLVSLVSDPAQYSLHSLRSGGATSAAAVSSVTRDDLKRHGRWASSAVDRYIEPTLDARLSITKKMAGMNL